MKNRSVPKVIIFSLITLGIYTLFWLRDTRKELVNRGQDVLPVKILLLPVAALVAVGLLQFLSHFLLQDTGESNLVLKISNILAIVVGILVVVAVIPLTIWWYYKYCQAVEAVTKGQTSLALSFGLLIVLSVLGFAFIWPGIIQDGFNRLSAPQGPGIDPPTVPTT